PSPSPSGSKTPLTPEGSPQNRKRDADTVEEEDKALDHARAVAPVHETPLHVCICQPDPKIPRPRNAFILYRQHHQAMVVAQNPGLANPEISKIIGEQWQNSPPEVKSEWKALAEEEKLRHQQQYPSYRYQPKRNGHRNSLSTSDPAERGKCQKCGGRTILAPSAVAHPSTPAHPPHHPQLPPSSAIPQTPGLVTPVARTLPGFRDLTLHSPAHRNGQIPDFPRHSDEPHDSVLSPGPKRRRFNGDLRVMPLRNDVPGPLSASLNPVSPFQYSQPPSRTAYHNRRESLPGLRGMVNPGLMAPPPRPMNGAGSGFIQSPVGPHDRSLTLPPLQSASSEAGGSDASAKSAEDQILSMSFQYKVRVLGQVAPPAPLSKDRPRGLLIAIEGDSPSAVAVLGKWLHDELSKSPELDTSLMPGPDVQQNSDKAAMVQYHLLATEWLNRSSDIIRALSPKDGDRKPIALIPNFSLHASNVFACKIVIGPHDAYSPTDHWQWTATQWRGIVGPDVTIYLKDSTEDVAGNGKAAVEITGGGNLIVVTRKVGGEKEKLGLDASTLRRLSFELGEWIRAFGS
ncbi:hypothetical protein K470DRAFT_196811, partial [Piedraia hortae CBS 480.64]